MKNKNINEAENEARRFLKKIADYKTVCAAFNTREFDPCKERSAIRRASMDLTRTLAKMRNEV